jgi:hypothetical protein
MHYAVAPDPQQTDSGKDGEFGRLEMQLEPQWLARANARCYVKINLSLSYAASRRSGNLFHLRLSAMLDAAG